MDRREDDELRRALIELMQAQAAYVDSYRAWKEADTARDPEAVLHLGDLTAAERRADAARRAAAFAERDLHQRVRINRHE